MARFLFVTFPASGHVNPALPVAKTLTERGHEVQWYTSPRYRERIEATGARFRPYKAVRDIDIERAYEEYPEMAKLKGLASIKFGLKIVVGLVAAKCEELSAILEEFPADAILGCTGAIPAAFIAEKMNLPYTLLNITILTMPGDEAPPLGMGLAPSTTALGRLRNRFLNWLVFRVVFRDINRELATVRWQVGLPPDSRGFFDVIAQQCDLYLQQSVASFEYPRRDLPDKVHFIGALLPEAPADFAPPAWWDELQDGRPVVLVTQGTLAKNLDELINPTLEGLAGQDLLVIGTAADQPLENVRPNPLPDNVRLEPFIPFAYLMPHVDVMVTNGGFGGVHSALTHGVPLVAGGQTEDKADVTLRIANAGVGINLKTKAPTPEQIKAAVNTVLATDHYRRKAQAMQAELADHDAPTRAADLIEELVATGKSERM